VKLNFFAPTKDNPEFEKITNGHLWKLLEIWKSVASSMVVNTKMLKIGDEILAYGLDHASSGMYNDSSKCKKFKLTKEIKSNGKRATKTLRGKNHR